MKNKSFTITRVELEDRFGDELTVTATRLSASITFKIPLRRKAAYAIGRDIEVSVELLKASPR